MSTELRPLTNKRLLYFAIAIMALGIGLRQARQTGSKPADDVPEVVAMPRLAFDLETGKPVLRAWVFRKDDDWDDEPSSGVKIDILTLYADGRMDPHVKEWDPAKHKLSVQEKQQGYCIRNGELLFAKGLRVKISTEDHSRLLAAINAAEIVGMSQADLALRMKRRSRVRTFRHRVMPGRTTTMFELRTNRGHTRLKAERLDWLVKQYNTADRESLQRILDLRALCIRLARNYVGRKVKPRDMRKLLDILLVGKRKPARAAGVSLWNYAGPEIVAPIIKQLQSTDKARRVRDMGMLLSGLGHRGIALDQVQSAMLEELASNKINSSVNNARLCLALQWCGVFGDKQVTASLYKFFTDKTMGKRKLIAPSPFVSQLLRYCMNTGFMGYTMLSARQMAGYALLRLARRRVATPDLGSRLTKLLLTPGFRKQERLAVLETKIAAWCTSPDDLKTLLAHANEVLPVTPTARLDYSVLLAVRDDITTTALVSTRVLRQKPALTSWQAYNLLSRNHYPGDPIMLNAWREFLHYSGTPASGALRVRTLAAMTLWRLRDETDLDNIVAAMVQAIANGSLDTYNLRTLDWKRKGTSLLLLALKRMPGNPKARVASIWIRKHTTQPSKPNQLTAPEEEDLVF